MISHWFLVPGQKSTPRVNQAPGTCDSTRPSLDSAMFDDSDSPKEFPDQNLPSETVALLPLGGEGGR
jgi:hypothetical protein